MQLSPLQVDEDLVKYGILKSVNFGYKTKYDQEAQQVVKVGTHENVADALTKYVSQDGMVMHMRSTNQHLTEGRHELAPATECQ